MKPYKWLSLLLALALLIGTLCGCGGNDSTLHDDDDDDDRRPSTSAPKEDPTDPIDSPTNPSAPEDIPDDPATPSDPDQASITMDDITIIYFGYSEERVFVQTGTGIHCINKKGQIIFTLEDGYFPADYPIRNGLAVITKEKGTLIDPVFYLCKADGTIVEAEDLLGTKLLLPGSMNSTNAEGEMFDDGYITVVNDTNQTVAIFDSSLNIVFNYSEELYDAFEGCKKLSTYSSNIYYNGLIFTAKSKSDYWIDINNGTINKNGNAYLKSIIPVNTSDFWVYDSKEYCFYDSRLKTNYGKPEPTLTLSDYTYKYGSWDNGKNVIIEQRQGEYSYIIIDEEGTTLSSGYLPGPDFSTDGQYFVFVNQENNHKISAIVVDCSGNVITNTTLAHDGSIFTTYISAKATNGVITLLNENKFIDFNFNPLF